MFAVQFRISSKEINSKDLNQGLMIGQVASAFTKFIRFGTNVPMSETNPKQSAVADSHEISKIFLGVGDRTVYDSLTEKIDNMIQKSREDGYFYVGILPDNMTADAKGIKSFGNYFVENKPNSLTTVKTHWNDSTFRMYSYASYGDYDVLFTQYTSANKSGVFGVVMNTDPDRTYDEFKEFVYKLAERFKDDTGLEGAVPTEGYEYLEWNAVDYQARLDKAEAAKKAKAEAAKDAEAAKKAAIAKKAKKDLKDIELTPTDTEEVKSE